MTIFGRLLAPSNYPNVYPKYDIRDTKLFFYSASGSWPKTIARTAQKYGARAIFRSGPNIWFLEPPEDRFEAFLAPGPKPLPERLKSMAREPFFGLDRISGFWNHQKTVLKHFWLLAQNHCQNNSKVWRASHFWVWTEYLVFRLSRTPFWRTSGPSPKTIARTAQNYGARAIFRPGPNIWFLKSPEGRFKAFLAPGPKPLPERLKSMERKPFFGLDPIFGFGSQQGKAKYANTHWFLAIALQNLIPLSQL